MTKHSTEYLHCQQCCDDLQGIAKQIEHLLNSEPLTGSAANKLQELSTSLDKLFRKLETT